MSRTRTLDVYCHRNNTIVDGAGFTVQGDGGGNGIDLSNGNNVTIKNTNIENFSYGICLENSSNNTISGNNVTNNYHGGIALSPSMWTFSSNNTITGNNVTANKYYGGIVLFFSNNVNVSGNNVTANDEGIFVWYSSYNNSISGNTVINNRGGGILLDYSSTNNIVSGNNVANNGYGVYCIVSTANKIYHNNFVDNTHEDFGFNGNANIWDDGYPSGGNYWSDYTGTDLYSGPYQNQTSSDGIGDTPYVIDSINQDNYPLMNPYPAYDVALDSLTSSHTVICQGYEGLVTVKVTNKGDFVETSNVTVYGNLTDSGNVTAIHTFENVILNNHDSTTLTFMLDTTDFAKGNYTISACAEPVPGETNTADNNLTGGWVVVSMVGDLTGGGHSVWDFVPDGYVDGSDLIVVARCFGSWLTAPPPMRWNANCDINNDGVVDGSDLIIVARHFGETSA